MWTWRCRYLVFLKFKVNQLEMQIIVWSNEYKGKNYYFLFILSLATLFFVFEILSTSESIYLAHLRMFHLDYNSFKYPIFIIRI